MIHLSAFVKYRFMNGIKCMYFADILTYLYCYIGAVNEWYYLYNCLTLGDVNRVLFYFIIHCNIVLKQH